MPAAPLVKALGTSEGQDLDELARGYAADGAAADGAASGGAALTVEGGDSLAELMGEHVEGGDAFLWRDGKVEFALDALINETIHSDSFFDTYEELGDLEERYLSLPEHPLDEQWGFVRYMFLGPKGKVPEGPF